MNRRPFAPDGFALGMLGFGLLLLFFPMMRVAGLAALAAAAAYWIIIGVFRSVRR